ncbi:MAG: hypothetical protein HXX19_16680 [Rhodoferax sp.]|nr:hypothetical protein [Rhodoferax sp.]
MPVPKKFIETTHAYLGLPQEHGRGAKAAEVYVPTAAPTEANLCDWIASATAGNAIQYHEGLLLRDRSEVASEFPTKERARIHAVARRAWIACELGLVHLFSQRIDEDHYRYLAVRSASCLKPPEIRNRLRAANDARVATRTTQSPL